MMLTLSNTNILFADLSSIDHSFERGWVVKSLVFADLQCLLLLVVTSNIKKDWRVI